MGEVALRRLESSSKAARNSTLCKGDFIDDKSNDDDGEGEEEDDNYVKDQDDLNNDDHISKWRY